MSRTYTVRLARPVVQTVTIEVEAWSKGSAVRKALHRVTSLPESEWRDRHPAGDDYHHHIEAVLDHQAVHESSANPQREILEFRSCIGAHDSRRYLLLAAETDTRVGRVIMQPWFSETDTVTQLELCSDWIEPISFIIENDGLDGDDGRSLASLDDQDPGNVIEFPLDLLDEDTGSHS